MQGEVKRVLRASKGGPGLHRALPFSLISLPSAVCLAPS